MTKTDFDTCNSSTSKNISFRLRIPVTSNKDDVWGVIAHEWLPVEEDTQFEIDSEGIKYIINGFDDRGRGREEVSRHFNPSFHFFEVEIFIKDVNTDILDLIRGSTVDMVDEGSTCGAAYAALVRKFLKQAITIINRMIDYLRVEKGQSWLRPHAINDGMLTTFSYIFNCMVKIDNDKYLPWHINCAQVVGPFSISSLLSREVPSYYLLSDDWQRLISYTRSSANLPTVLELLSNAELLFTQGNLRSAVIEGVIALEIAVNRFCEKPNVQERKDLSNSKQSLSGLKKTLDHIGFSTTFIYLLPLVFTEEQFSADLFINCKNAIELRNTIVHQGQKRILVENAEGSVAVRRKACEILRSFTKERVAY